MGRGTGLPYAEVFSAECDVAIDRAALFRSVVRRPSGRPSAGSMMMVLPETSNLTGWPSLDSSLALYLSTDAKLD